MDSSVVQHAANVLEFVSGRAARLQGQVADLNPAIAVSWRRCALDYSIDPARHYAPCVLDDASLARRREQSADLVQIASAEIDWLYDYIAKSGYALVLTDASGVVLYEKTDVDAGGHIPQGRADLRRGLERASRGNEWHRHLHRREPVGDRPPGRTLSLLSHRPVLFRRTHSGSGRFAGRGSRRLHVERAVHARRGRAHAWRWSTCPRA